MLWTGVENIMLQTGIHNDMLQTGVEIGMLQTVMEKFLFQRGVMKNMTVFVRTNFLSSDGWMDTGHWTDAGHKHWRLDMVYDNYNDYS